MDRELKTADPSLYPTDSADGVVAIVGSGSCGRVIAANLESRGWLANLYDGVEDLALADELPGLVVFAERTLIEGARELKALGPSGKRPPTIVVPEGIRPGEVRLALAIGVAGVVLADSLAVCLFPCVTAVVAGLVSVPQAHARQVEAAALSPREKQILGLVVMGYMNGEIAERLVVAESTIKSHLSSAFGKLGVRSRSEAVELILDSERGLGMGILSLGGEPIETAGSESV